MKYQMFVRGLRTLNRPARSSPCSVTTISGWNDGW